MSSEFLEKIRNIIVTLFVLFFSFLIAWTAFCTLPVHAAESVSGIQIFESVHTEKGSWVQTETYSLNKTAQYNIFMFGDPDHTHLMYIAYVNPDDDLSVAYSSVIKYENPSLDDNVYNSNDSISKITTLYTLSDGTKIYLGNIGGTDGQKFVYKGNYGLYETSSDMTKADNLRQFLEHFYVIKDITPSKVWGDSEFDPHDDAYAFTGFSMSGKTASWTGTTERSYLLDMDVEEWVNYTYGFATSEDQEVSSFIDAEAHYPTSDKKLTLPWDEMEANKKEGEFIRQVNIIPCYGTSGAGFYFGSPVCVYFNKNGKIESIVQNSVPTDGEVIGNNISLIGFRYDTSFHAEFVDVWSNAVNCSAFDLGGSQYLSLGVKALYYNGQSKDIDFVSLDRKNLVWDKTFDSFKTFNGSGIKQLFFTPYIKTGVNNPWNKGNSIVIDFDVNGNATSSFDTGDDGTVHLSDFKLTGVVWNKPMLAYGTITWTGTTANSDMSIVPDSDTLVVCSYPVYDSSLNESYETYDTVTIGKGSIRVYIDSLIDKYSNAGKTWNGEMWLTPCYKKGGVLYMGEPVIVNCTKGTVSDIEVDESTGTANQVDKTDENKSYADAILSSGNNFFSIVKGLIASIQQLPELIAILFSFLPGWVNALIAGSIFVIFVCRILGR